MKRSLLCPYAVLAVLLVALAPGLDVPAAAEGCDPGYGSPADRIAACAGGYSDPIRLAKALAKGLGLSADSAGRLAQALAQAHSLQGDRRNLEPAVRKIESQFISLLRQEPASQAIAVEAGWFYAYWSLELRTPDPALLDLVHASPDPAGLAKNLVDPGTGGLGAQILLVALDARPASSSLWEKAALSVPSPAWRIAFHEEAYRTAAAGPQADLPATARFAAGWLQSLLEQGLTRQALAAYQGLPPAVRERLGRRGTGDRDTEHCDLRLGMAAAAFLEGDGETARTLWSLAVKSPVAPAFKPSDHPVEKARVRQVAAVERHLVERALAPAAGDGFDLFAEAVGLDRIWAGSEATGHLLLARLAAREGYPALAAYELGNAGRTFDDSREEPFDPVRGVLPRVRSTAAALKAERTALSHSLHDEAQAAETAARNGLSPDPSAATIARLLRTPPPTAFEEHPLPEGVPLLNISDEAAKERLAAAAKGLSLPSNAPLARVERDGRRVAAIVSSQGYDPVGEISPGAYWVLLSNDGGATWSGPFYTGSRMNQPYVVRPVSALPLLAGDHLHVEVEVRELDPTKIVFPPIGLALKRTARGLYLDIPLATLTRDRDGDGLTDLAEARLLTDPNAADTDGDGIPDGADPLPTVRQDGDPSPASQALAAFAQKMAGVGGRAIIVGLYAPGAPLLCCPKGSKAPEPDRALFFIGERPLFAALHPGRRIVVLTHAEAKDAEKRFGPFFPIDLQLFLLDHSGRHALIVWSASWQGGIVRIDEKDGAWTATEVSAWIT
jgi:hypothetical protein